MDGWIEWILCCRFSGVVTRRGVPFGDARAAAGTARVGGRRGRARESDARTSASDGWRPREDGDERVGRVRGRRGGRVGRRRWELVEARARAHGFFADARRAFGRRETSIGVEGTMEAIVRDYEGRRERMAKELGAVRPHGVRAATAGGEARGGGGRAETPTRGGGAGEMCAGCVCGAISDWKLAVYGVFRGARAGVGRGTRVWRIVERRRADAGTERRTTSGGGARCAVSVGVRQRGSDV